MKRTELLAQVLKLLKYAQDRYTNQGVEIYEVTLKKISEASTQNEIDDLAKKLNHALVGIEAHGYFTSEEFEVVKGIRSMYIDNRTDR